MRISRRDCGKLALSALSSASAFAGANTDYKGVQFGICSYSFRGMGLDVLIHQMKAVTMGQLELEAAFVEPDSGGRGQTPDQRLALRNWRLGVGLDEIRSIRKGLDDAGIEVFAYNIPFNDSFTDAEIDRVFLIARLLGAQALNSATTLTMAPRLAQFAESHNMRVGLHPTANASRPDAIGSGESYRKALAISPYLGACPDLNGWKTWGPDPPAFLREIAPRITTLHTHDSKPAPPRSVGVPFGQGTNPIREVLRLMRAEKFTFVAMLERLWNLPEGGDNLAALRDCLSFCKAALEQ
jgi:sugar phosphate isomerase/epimerase